MNLTLTPEQLKKFNLTDDMYEPVHIITIRKTKKSTRKKYKLYVLRNGVIYDCDLNFEDIVDLDVVGGYGKNITVEFYVEQANLICGY